MTRKPQPIRLQLEVQRPDGTTARFVRMDEELQVGALPRQDDAYTLRSGHACVVTRVAFAEHRHPDEPKAEPLTIELCLDLRDRPSLDWQAVAQSLRSIAGFEPAA